MHKVDMQGTGWRNVVVGAWLPDGAVAQPGQEYEWWMGARCGTFVRAGVAASVEVWFLVEEQGLHFSFMVLNTNGVPGSRTTMRADSFSIPETVRLAAIAAIFGEVQR